MGKRTSPAEQLGTAAPGMWLLTPCRTWSEEKEVLAAIPLLLDVLNQARRVCLKPGADEELSAAVFRALRAIK